MKRSILLLFIALNAAPARADRKVTGDGYTVEVATSGGDAGSTVATITITATGDYHVNREFPTSLEVTAGTGVAIDRAKQSARDAAFADRQAVFTVAATPRAKGSHAVVGKLKFAICAADSCLPRRATVDWSVR